jgi:hypothetical protein
VALPLLLAVWYSWRLRFAVAEHLLEPWTWGGQAAKVDPFSRLCIVHPWEDRGAEEVVSLGLELMFKSSGFSENSRLVQSRLTHLFMTESWTIQNSTITVVNFQLS